MVVAILVACATVIFATAAEVLHARRVSRVAGLAFGPSRRPAVWAHLAPFLRVLAMTGVAWGLTTLLTLKPKVHKLNEIPDSEFKDLVLVLDVSPSMRLADAGPTKKQKRCQRAADLLKSFFERTPIELYRLTIIATYTGAKPIVERTKDMEVVRNILEDLPMEYAFKPGPTELFAGLDLASKIAHPWKPKSATLVVISDGDTVPATGMPKMPDSVAHVLVVGVGDTLAGQFIDGHQSRQNASTLRQLSTRLGGTYHDGNEKQIATDVLRAVTFYPVQSALEKLTEREYALLAVAVCSVILAVLPVFLHYFGTQWRPGVARRQPANLRRDTFASEPAGVVY